MKVNNFPKIGIIFLVIMTFLINVGWGKDIIKIGISCARSGPAKSLGERYLMGWLACFKQINDKGGVNGKEIKWVVLDDSYKGNRAVENTKALLTQGVDLLAGYVGTPTTRAVIDWMEKNKVKIPFFFPLTGAKIMKRTVFANLYAIRPFYGDEIKLMVDYFIAKGYTRFGIFYQDDTFGLSGRNGFLQAINKYNLLSCYEGKYNKRTLEMEKAVEDALKKKPEVIILVGTAPPAAKFIKEVLRQSGGYNPIFVCLSFILPEQLIDLVGSQTSYAHIYVSQVVPCPSKSLLPIVRSYRQAIKNYYPTCKFSFTSLEGYIGAKLLCEILKKASSENFLSIKNAVESLKNCDIGLDVNFSFCPLSHRSKLFAGLYKWQQGEWKMVAERKFGFVEPGKNSSPVPNLDKTKVSKKKSVEVVLASVQPETSNKP